MAVTMATKIACMVLVSMVLATPHVEASLTCGQVIPNLLPCLNYLKSGAGPDAKCCSGVKAVNALAKTTPDRQTACGCIKSAAANYGVGGSNAASLPGKCGVSIPYKISPSTDCSKVK